jgi:hypothetical protein
MELPEPFEEATDLERLILLKIFRPEAVVKALKKFVQNSIGKEFIKSQLSILKSHLTRVAHPSL